MADFVANLHFLEEIHVKIRAKHEEVNGKWDAEVYNGLERLESVMKETVRLAPGTYLVYGRVILNDYVLSEGLKLRKGQFICISGYSRATDPDCFTIRRNTMPFGLTIRTYKTIVPDRFQVFLRTTSDGVLGDGLV